jgi:DNA modification methylase
MFEPSPRDLAEFLARHARAYDPATDDYERPPFAADIKEGRNDATYNAHPYHTKVPPRSVIPYILHYTQPGDLVLDPFCGTGMIGVAAQMCADPPTDILESSPEFRDRVGPRACILSDLSPAACHIAYNYNTPVDIEALKREFERIKVAVKDKFDWLYGTEHYEPAVGLYDPANHDVASRLRKLPSIGTTHTSLGGEPRTWELLTKGEVEARLGYPVTHLSPDEDWGDLDVAKVLHWVCVPATIQYTIWSDVYRCEGFVTIEEPTGRVSTRGKNAGKPAVARKRVARGCGLGIVLWDAAVDQKSGEVSETFACPHCGLEWKKIQVRREPAIAVKSNIEYAAIQHRQGKTRLVMQTSMRPVTKREHELIDEVNRAKINAWFPTIRFDRKGPQYRRNALSARKIDYVTDLYTRRNLHALALLWEAIAATGDARLRSACEFAFTAIVTRSSWLNRLRSSGAGDPQTGTIYISSLTREENVLRLFEGRLSSHLKLSGVIGDSRFSVQNASACSLPHVPDASIDYVFTDPPFGSNIYYSEVNLIWEAWLGKVTDATEEAVVHRKNDGGTKRLPDYARLMQAAFKEIFRVLKPGRWCTVEFNNKDGAVFEAIKQAVRDAGFEIVNMLLLDKTQKTFKQVKGAEGIEDVVDKDVLFNLHKPAIVQAETRAEDHDVEQQVAAAVRQHLQSLPERIKSEPTKYNDEHRTTATINSMLMNVLIPRGVSVELLNLPFIERVCGRYFRKMGQRWYLRGEAVGGNGGDRLFAEEIAVTDELTAIDWLRYQLHDRPVLLGELRPLWMRATGLVPAEVSQSLVLEDLLIENFWPDADSNRWREPTPEEREKMNDDRSLRTLHDADRFVNSTLRRKTTDEERCEWIDTMFQACRAIEDNKAEALPALRGFDMAEAYSLIPRLFQSVLRDQVSDNAYARAEKQTRAVSQRLARQMDAQSGNSHAPPDTKQGALDFDK